MSSVMKSKSQTHRDIAIAMGSDLGNAGFPMALAFLAVGLAAQPFKAEMSGLLLISLCIGGSLLLGLLLMHYYVAFNGERILKAVEQDYGPKTRQHVFNSFAAAKPGDLIDLDIPGVARAYREESEGQGKTPSVHEAQPLDDRQADGQQDLGYFKGIVDQLVCDIPDALWRAAYQDREFNVVNKVCYYSPTGEVAEPF